ncbi:allophanate hydrolase subunit 1 [Saccharopolyspora sp. ASAGF58]|uniref:5-oxoprolinase subunit B family protein n=1 Tax=Saccharopolyspora sp. ASAGF58 TaxID=2719023 RepID=UPI001445E282|nr:carboxyltransferase domain-containing protein [Saccharopolyspora sp. ASAGF58]
MTSSTVICRTPPAGERPAIAYRQAGDRSILVEYGEPDVDLRLNFVVVAVLGILLAEPPAGFVEAAPGLRAILISFDPEQSTREAILRELEEIHERLPALSSLIIPSRRITLPIAFDDSTSREAVERYVATIRHDAPYTRGGSNIDYIVENSSLSGPEELYSTVTGVSWWTAFTGFFPGLPFLFPLHPGKKLFAPKYNPPRAWTAEGAVGIGGACAAIFPVESTGSYQLFGRTVPIYDIYGQHRVFHREPILIQPGDQVRFVRVTEEELLEARRDVFDNRYEYSIEDAPFCVADYLRELGNPAETTSGGTASALGSPARPS